MLQDFRLYLLTWNVLGSPPEEDLHEALNLHNVDDPNALPELYAIGLQEVSAKPQDRLTDILFYDPWINKLTSILEKWNYVRIKEERLVGIMLIVFVKRPIILHIRGLQTDYTRTGLKGTWGNKGGVSIRFSVFGCSICFVTCHLAPHDEMLKQRIEDYNSIVDGQKFKDSLAESILTHDYVFWLGDLNFRIDEYSKETIKSMVEKKNFAPLLSKDQLNKVKQEGLAFSEFIEGPITFPPSYKFQVNGDDYDIVKRKPAWTDRILYRCTSNAYEDVTLEVKQHDYRSHSHYLQSDHKPVTSLFSIKVFSKPSEEHIEFLPIETWLRTGEGVAWYTASSTKNLNMWDWVGVFKENFTNISEYGTYVWASTTASNTPPPVFDSGEGSSCNEVEQQMKSHCRIGPWYKIVFTDLFMLTPGNYVLVYLSNNFSDIVGISTPFQISEPNSSAKKPKLNLRYFFLSFYKYLKTRILLWLREL